MKKFYRTFKYMASKPIYWVKFTTRLIIGVLVAVIRRFILDYL
ncbi:hypothetical protein [Paenibacillus odorifer]|nr:hypothetical protein [Paenibacillus odorifer]